MPAKVDPLQLSVSAPSRLAAAASSLSAALISWAGAGPHARNASAANKVICDRKDLRASTEPSRKFIVCCILEQIPLRSSLSTTVRQLRPAPSPDGRGVG